MPSIAIVDTYYPGFLKSPKFIEAVNAANNYQQARQNVMALRFGTSDTYSFHLNQMGWVAQEIVPNSLQLQSIWCNEQDISLWPKIEKLPPSHIARVPGLRRMYEILPTLHRVLKQQISRIDPDVLYFQDLNFASTQMLSDWRKQGIFLVGQIASPLPPPKILRSYDLVLSSLPNQVAQIRSTGTKSEFLRIGFDKRLLSEINKVQRDKALTFVGGISKHHQTTIPLLEEVARLVPEVEIFGYGSENCDSETIKSRHRGEAWAIEMYQLLAQSYATINRHISISQEYANNMRLFESTGMGSLLITDKKKNLSSYFEDESEVLTYRNLREAAQIARWAVDNVDEGMKIAQAGQMRTFVKHGYDSVIQELHEIICHAV